MKKPFDNEKSILSWKNTFDGKLMYENVFYDKMDVRLFCFQVSMM